MVAWQLVSDIEPSQLLTVEHMTVRQDILRSVERANMKLDDDLSAPLAFVGQRSATVSAERSSDARR